jgi:integrase
MIYKRGKTYWIKYYWNGKPYYESSKSPEESKARCLLRKREGEISGGKLPGIYFDRVKFDELADDFLADYRINQMRLPKRAALNVRHLWEYFEGFRVPQITTPKVQAYIEQRSAWLCSLCETAFIPGQVENIKDPLCPHCDSKDIMKGASNATINRELAALKRMLNLGAKQTPPEVDRVPYIPMLKENNTRKGFFEHADFLALTEQLPDCLRGVVTFAYRTGWRLSEITGLTWDRLDLENGMVRLEAGETKNEEARTIYLYDELKELIHGQRQAQKQLQALTPFVFPNIHGNGQIKQFYKAWGKACEGAGIGKKLFHDFRRTAVRNMVRSGVPEAVAMNISGHKTREVFERYNIIDNADLKLAAEKQQAYLESQMVTKTVTILDFIEKRANQQCG